MVVFFTKRKTVIYNVYQNLRNRRLLCSFILIVVLLIYCEWLHYYFVLAQCMWPYNENVLPHERLKYLKVIFLADTHFLGFAKGHWFDKLRREWQMKRAFQTSMFLHRPDVVFVLGDLLDEGKWCSDEEFEQHVYRFNSAFSVPAGTRRHLVVGNHDIGFHYMVTAHLRMRFEDAFHSKSVAMIQESGIIFVLVNSMALERDGCSMCREARHALMEISRQLHSAKHFPLYRRSDAICETPDAAPSHLKTYPFTEKYDTLSKEATSEARISREDFAVKICLMPDETTVICVYVICGIIILITACVPSLWSRLVKKNR